jgi:hypothetical protein
MKASLYSKRDIFGLCLHRALHVSPAKQKRGRLLPFSLFARAPKQQEFFWLLIHGLDNSGNTGAWMSSKPPTRFAGKDVAW